MTKSKHENIETAGNLEWTVTTNRFVAFLDILGFKAMLNRMTHRKMYKLMTTFSRSTKMAEWDGYSQSVKFFIFSDSVIIFSKDDKWKSEKEFFSYLTQLAGELLIDKIPYRGAVAWGKITLDFKSSIYFGQPLIDAYLLSEELLFYGINLHATAEKKIKMNAHTFDIENGIYSIVDLNCSYKGGSSESKIVVPFRIFTDERLLMRSIEKMKFQSSGAIRRYIDNTKRMFTEIIENYEASLNY